MNKKQRDIEVRQYGQFGDLKKGWGYYAIFPIESENEGHIFSANIRIRHGHLLLSTQKIIYPNKHSKRSIFGVEPLENIEIADRKAYEQALRYLSTELWVAGNIPPKTKIVDRTSKANQLELNFN